MENIFSSFDYFFFILFHFIKYILVFILVILGMLIILSLRGINIYKHESSIEENDIYLKKIRIIVGCIYIILGCGILFNYLLYLLIWIIPDGLIFFFFNTLHKNFLNNPNLPPEVIQNFDDFFGILYNSPIYHVVFTIPSFFAL